MLTTIQIMKYLYLLGTNTNYSKILYLVFIYLYTNYDN